MPLLRSLSPPLHQPLAELLWYRDMLINNLIDERKESLMTDSAADVRKKKRLAWRKKM